MFIGDLLNKYKNIKIADFDLKNFIISVIKKELDYKLDTKNIKRQGGVVYINTDPIIKSEILINKNKLLNLIKDFDKNIIDLK